MRDLFIFIYTGSPAEGSPAKSGGGLVAKPQTNLAFTPNSALPPLAGNYLLQ